MNTAKHLRLGYALTQGALSVVLLIAVASKAVLFGAPGNALSSLALRVLVLLELLVEWFIAVWLMSGVAQVWSRRAAMSLLLMFVTVTTWRQVAGDRDCHCFGALRVPPLVTLSFDLIALFALYGLGRTAVDERPKVAKDRQRTGSSPLLRLRVSFTAMIAIVLPMSVFVAERRLLGFETALGHVIPLSPQSWIGSLLPLLQDMDSHDRADLMEGDKTVIFFSHDCDICKRYLARRADALSSDPGAIRRIRLIDVAAAEGPGNLSPPFQYVHLNRSVALLGAVPLELTLKNGTVETVRHPE